MNEVNRLRMGKLLRKTREMTQIFVETVQYLLHAEFAKNAAC